ncbi:hypothetical protein [Salsuginibacillus kocurii]|uniref:hypothetical protein n=1 Tax=Salsuginibacillus kocurii TaxID=427078 RepID=UPI0003A49055|nr:hypothetical protein [Salsuginibacillus kocurii]
MSFRFSGRLFMAEGGNGWSQGNAARFALVSSCLHKGRRTAIYRSPSNELTYFTSLNEHTTTNEP